MYIELFERVLEAVHDIQVESTNHTEQTLACEIQALVDELLEHYIQGERAL